MANTTQIQGTTIHVGDTIRVHYRIIEKDIVAGKTKREKHEEQKERTQVFEGIVIAIRGSGAGENFIVRRIGTGNIGIERIFPAISPWIRKVDVKKLGKVRRAKLYYLRQKTRKEAGRIVERTYKEDLEEPAKKVEIKSAPTAEPVNAESTQQPA